MENTNRESRRGWKRTVLIVLCVVLALIMFAMLFATVYINSLFDRIKGLDSETLSSEQIESIYKETDAIDPNFTGPSLSGDDVTWSTDPVDTIGGENIINILLIGQDRREGEGRQRSDAMILCTINKRERTVTLTSFMRDMYVKIPGHRGNKINACYQIGGMPLLNSCLESNFGIHVDGNIEVDFNGFMDIVDLLGGVDMELTQAEANYLNHRGNWGVSENDAWQLTKGVNRLNGSQALAYSRIRMIAAEEDELGRSDSDFGRTSRQRRMLSALLERFKSMGLSDMNKVMPLLNKMVDLIATDMDKGQIIQYVAEVLPLLSELKIETLRIPADGMYYEANVDGLDAIVPNLQKNNQLLKEKLTE